MSESNREHRNSSKHSPQTHHLEKNNYPATPFNTTPELIKAVQRVKDSSAKLGQTDVIALQRALGSRHIQRMVKAGRLRRTTSKPVSATTLQRSIKVENIDYDPKANEFRDGIINTGLFFTALKGAIPNVEPYRNYRNQFDNATAALREKAEDPGYKASDINALAALIVEDLGKEYAKKQLTGFAPVQSAIRKAFLGFVTDALVKNIAPYHNVEMNEAEASAFDTLKAIVTAEKMSRAKGVPSKIAHARLPSKIREGITTVFGDMKTENALWTVDRLKTVEDRKFVFPSLLGADVGNRQKGKRYQGNHSNLAGWLPDQAAAPSPVQLLLDQIKAQANHPTLKATISVPNAPAILQVEQAAPASPHPYRGQFLTLLNTNLNNFQDADLRRSLWYELTYGVSGYIEFSLPGDISRLVYDVVNSRLYVSAHYKWREGYNPWFEITDAPDKPL